MDNLFSTHPNTENRIAALEQLAGEMGAPRTRPAARETRGGSVPATGVWNRGTGGGRSSGRATGPWG